MHITLVNEVALLTTLGFSSKARAIIWLSLRMEMGCGSRNESRRGTLHMHSEMSSLVLIMTVLDWGHVYIKYYRYVAIKKGMFWGGYVEGCGFQGRRRFSNLHALRLNRESSGSVWNQVLTSEQLSNLLEQYTCIRVRQSMRRCVRWCIFSDNSEMNAHTDWKDSYIRIGVASSC